MSHFSKQHSCTFAGKNSWTDFGLYLIDKKITFPSKNKVTILPVYSNDLIDLSMLYDEQVYSDRTIQMTFLALQRDTVSKAATYLAWTKIINWLMPPAGRQVLVDDTMPDYYYLGEVIEAPTWDDFLFNGKFTVTWTCYPFRIHRLFEGNDVWDTFNFELDVSQTVQYDIVGSRKVTLLNTGSAPIQPSIIADSPMMVSMSRIGIQVSAGQTDSDNLLQPLTLQVGVNLLTITGQGHIEFRWHKEVI